jgi:hypothetical protein
LKKESVEDDDPPLNQNDAAVPGVLESVGEDSNGDDVGESTGESCVIWRVTLPCGDEKGEPLEIQTQTNADSVNVVIPSQAAAFWTRKCRLGCSYLQVSHGQEHGHESCRHAEGVSWNEGSV